MQLRVGPLCLRPFRMKIRKNACLLAVLAYFCAFAWAAPATSPTTETSVATEPAANTLTLPAYIAELDHLLAEASQLDQNPDHAGEILRNLPFGLHIQDGQNSFDVPLEWLRTDLIELLKNPAHETAARISERLSLLKTEAITFQQHTAGAQNQKKRLAAILAAKEFSSVHGPTWFDRLKQRLALYFISILAKIFGSSAIPTIGNVLVYTLIGLAVLGAGFWLYRNIRTGTHFESVMPAAMPISSKEWALWMAEAQTAASEGRWRDAVHLAYWCGISFLEAQGLWQPDRARTPREYLRLLPSSSIHRQDLMALTRGFEVVWYGGRDAGPESFAETLAHLEKLGCRSI